MEPKTLEQIVQEQSEVIQKQAKSLDNAMTSIKRLLNMQIESTEQFIVSEYMKQKPLSKYIN